MSELTKLKISLALTGQVDSLDTRQKKSESRTGSQNHYYGKSLSKAIFNAEAEAIARRFMSTMVTRRRMLPNIVVCVKLPLR